MLKTLKKLLGAEQNNTQSDKEAIYRPNLPTNPNFVTEPHKIAKLLQDIEATSPLCTITFEGLKEEFSSSILTVNSLENQLILDELLPDRGNAILHRTKSLKLSTHFNGIHLAFKLDNIRQGSSQGMAYYKAGFPERIYYPQRRKAPRIEITSIYIPFAGIASKNNISIGGSVFDISRSGIGIKLPDNRSRIQRGDVIKKCSITLEDDYCLEFDLAVRFVKRAGAGNPQTNIGGHFENLSSKSQNKLSYFIASLERQEIRKQKA